MKERFWRYLILVNLALALISLWVSFSQSLLLSQLLTSKYIAVAPQSVSNTSPVIVNPLTTNAFMITALSGISMIISVVVIVAIYKMFD